MDFDITPGDSEKFADFNNGFDAARIIIPSKSQLEKISKEMSEALSRDVDVNGIIASNVYVFAGAPMELVPRWKYMENLKEEYFGRDSKDGGAERCWKSFESTLISSRLNYRAGTGRARFDMIVYSEKN